MSRIPDFGPVPDNWDYVSFATKVLEGERLSSIGRQYCNDPRFFIDLIAKRRKVRDTNIEILWDYINEVAWRKGIVL